MKSIINGPRTERKGPPVLRSFEPVLHTQKACRDRQASLVTAHFREQSGRVSNYFSCQLLGLCHVGAHASHPRRRAQRREASWELTEMRELLQLSALVLRRETNSAGASVVDARGGRREAKGAPRGCSRVT